MEWFEGDVSAAVGAAKISSTYLLVFVDGKDASSYRILTLLESFAQLSKKNYIGVRIELGSKAYNQLTAIYGSLDSSSLLIIDGSSGVAKDSFPGTIEESKLLQSLLSILPEKPIVHISIPSNVKDVMTSSSTSSLSRSVPLKKSIEEKPTADIRLNNSTPEENPTSARIQLKLQSGVSEIVTCDIKNTLADVRKKASDIFNLRRAFDLAIPYPRKTFSAEEESETIETLGLYPASTLLVLPRENSLQPKTFSHGLFLALTPILNFINQLWRFFFPGRQNEETQSTSKLKKS